jgi:hypothetical protein
MEEKQWKYIVYETTNLINGKIYVGLHKTKDPDTFDGYIGDGIYITQPYTYMNPKYKFQYAVKKYGPKNFKRKTLAIFNTLKEASDLEEQIVNEKFLERSDVYNMILGGLGGYFITNRIKVFQYDVNGNYLKEYESFADAALQLNCDYTLISYAVRKKAKAKGFFWNTDKVEKLDLSNYNLGLNHSIKIFFYSLEGKYLGGFKTQTSAERKTGISASCIKKSCILGIPVKNKYYISYIKAESYDKARTEYLKTRSVYKYNSDGSFCKEYETQLEAELENKTNITKAIKLKSPDENGFLWGLEKLENYNVPKKRVKRQVGKYDLEGNLVKIYESATAAEKENGTSIWKVLAGTNKTHKQHIYKYLT